MRMAPVKDGVLHWPTSTSSSIARPPSGLPPENVPLSSYSGLTQIPLTHKAGGPPHDLLSPHFVHSPSFTHLTTARSPSAHFVSPSRHWPAGQEHDPPVHTCGDGQPPQQLLLPVVGMHEPLEAQYLNPATHSVCEQLLPTHLKFPPQGVAFSPVPSGHVMTELPRHFGAAPLWHL
jgi:hypothetical protein